MTLGDFYTVAALCRNSPHDTLLRLWVVRDISAAERLIAARTERPPDNTTHFEVAGPFFMGEDLCEDRRFRTVCVSDREDA